MRIVCPQLRADNVGSLVRIKAIVTRASDVKPRLVYAAYTCTQCQNETIQEVCNSNRPRLYFILVPFNT
jgi:DNA replicative helicase MCM subunit Mcm2 (Cdc46/Mcm family)